MDITDAGVPVDGVIDAVKAAVRTAGISATDTDRPMRVVSVRLVLNAVATMTAGAKLEFTLPFIGMPFRFGKSVTRKDTHVIDVTLVPPDLAPPMEIRDGVDDVLVEAIDTVTAIVARAAGGDDPFVLKESSIELTFAITDTGSISLGVEADTTDTVTHTLEIKLDR